MKKILVSACLLGRDCKYNGGNNYDENILAYVKDKPVIAVCPEVLAGFGVPRTPIELVDGVPVDRNGNCVAGALRAAVDSVLEQIRGEDIDCAILKSRSPTCGVKQIYDGTFSGRLVDGSGLLAKALMEAGYCVIDAEDV